MGTERLERSNGVQSVVNGMRVLQALTALQGPATLGAVAQECEMPSPQAHRYLRSLIEAGMARQDAATGRYELGHAALRIGLAALARTDAFVTAERIVGGFAESSGRTVQLSALGPGGPTVTRFYAGRPPVVTSLRVGSVLPMLLSATGQVFSSFTPEAEVASLIEAEAASAGLAPADVAGIRARVRAQGFAHDAGRLIPGLRATAFPIRDLQGRAILVATAISIDAVDRRGGKEAVAELRLRCEEVSSELGWGVA